MASPPSCELALSKLHSPRAAPQVHGQTATRLGGYNCEFIEKPPEVLQSDCPICLSILREPHQVTCCGYSFCRTCIDRVCLDSKPCPTCNVEGFTTFANKGLQRSLKQLKVYCSHKDDGCEWTGELGELDKHLNKNPADSGNRLHSCQYVEVDCIYCTKPFKRSAMEAHLNCCPQRPYSCDYCSDYEGSFNDVVNKHYPVCPNYPLPCPNRCNEVPGGMIERQNLEHHLKEECVLTVVECDFHYAGCGVKLPRKDMAGHLAESLVAHMSLLAVHGKKTAADTQKALEERDKKIAQMREEIKELERENKVLKDSLHSHLHTPPVTFTMTNFEQHKRNRDTWVSPSFYTHPHGYKMCLTVSVKTDIWSNLADYITVQACLMRGEFDDSLQWPFQSDVYIRILNQLSDDDHIAFAASFSIGPAVSGVGLRITAGDRHSSGRPLDIPITLKSLVGDQGTRQYLKDDCIQIQVTRVVNTVQFTQPCFAINSKMICTPPVQFVMNNFEQHKSDGDIWRSPSFYSHSQGYRLCVNVGAKGYNDGKVSHLFVSIVILCGEYDSTLRKFSRVNFFALIMRIVILYYCYVIFTILSSGRVISTAELFANTINMILLNSSSDTLTHTGK